METQTDQIVYAPSQYSCEQFDVMEAPESCWPVTTLVKIRGGEADGRTIEIPTHEIWVAGDFVARRYACTPMFRIQKWLTANGVRGIYISVINAPRIESEKRLQAKK
jgi:hypothetical protein